MSIMIPIFTFKTLKHVSFFFVNQFLVVGQSTVAVKVIKRLIIEVFIVLVVLFVVQLATLWQFTISAIASEVELAVKLINFMSFMTHQHAPETKAMGCYLILILNFLIFHFFKEQIFFFIRHFSKVRFLISLKLFFDHILVTGTAAENLLVHVAFFLIGASVEPRIFFC
jgi:hypothetical protein